MTERTIVGCWTIWTNVTSTTFLIIVFPSRGTQIQRGLLVFDRLRLCALSEVFMTTSELWSFNLHYSPTDQIKSDRNSLFLLQALHFLFHRNFKVSNPCPSEHPGWGTSCSLPAPACKQIVSLVPRGKSSQKSPFRVFICLDVNSSSECVPRPR